MADKENQVTTRSSKPSRQRPIEPADGVPVKKKRVVLGDLTNTPGLNRGAGTGETRKPYHEKKTANEVDLESVVSPGADEQQSVGYASSVYLYLRSLELEAIRRPLSNYMEEIQRDIHPSMREILVDWLVEVAEEYKLVSDTLYLTVNYIDRYLSSHNLIRTKLQLLGVSCMLVAAKFEEITPPHIEHFSYITDNTYTKEEIANMEMDVLKFLDFQMGNPTTKTFLRIFIKAAQENSKLPNKFEFLCHYLGELSLLDYGCVRYIPSLIAASAIFLSQFTIQPKSHPWTLALQQHTGYKPYQLKQCVLKLHSLQLRRETSTRAIKQKYMDNRFKRVASLSPPPEVPACYFEAPNE